MGRSHKKRASGSHGASAKKKQKQKHAQHVKRQRQGHSAASSEAEGDDPARMVRGWTQRDYQQRAGAEAVAHISTEDDSRSCSNDGSSDSSESDTEAVVRPSGSRKKRAIMAAWMLEPGVASVAGSSASSLCAASAAAASSSSDLSSVCWNSLPRDCLLHVFSFFDLHACARITGTSRYWHSALHRGVLARVLEQSWRILRQKKQAMPKQTGIQGDSDSSGMQLLVDAPLRSLSDVISPPQEVPACSLDDDEHARGHSVAALQPPASPSLSAIQPPAAVKAALSALAAVPSAQGICVPGSAFSASSSLFKASLLHLRSLYRGQKQLLYSLHSNPLWQNLSVCYHLSACHQRVLECVRTMHVALFRVAHGGKWPRSTKLDDGARAEEQQEADELPRQNSAAPSSPVSNVKTRTSDDLMPLHFNLDASVHHRSAFLSELQRSQKHIWEMLHSTPVHVFFGFDGSSLPSVQLQHIAERIEERLQTQLSQQAQKQGSKARRKAAQVTDAALCQPVRDPEHEGIVLSTRADLPAQFVDASTGTSAAAAVPAHPALVSAADAVLVSATLRRMAVLARIWGTYLHSSVAQQMQDEAIALAAAQRAAAAGVTDDTHASAAENSSSASAPKALHVSALEREWDSCAHLWRMQHRRLLRLHLFWHTLATLLRSRESSSSVSSAAVDDDTEMRHDGAVNPAPDPGVHERCFEKSSG